MKRVKALSLIEVLAALALIAGTLTGLLLAQARSVAQLAATKRSSAAHALAGALILQWKTDASSIPASAGTFDGHPRLRWVRETTPSSLSDSRNLREIRLKVYHRDEPAGESLLVEIVWLEEPPENEHGARP